MKGSPTLASVHIHVQHGRKHELSASEWQWYWPMWEPSTVRKKIKYTWLYSTPLNGLKENKEKNIQCATFNLFLCFRSVSWQWYCLLRIANNFFRGIRGKSCSCTDSNPSLKSPSALCVDQLWSIHLMISWCSGWQDEIGPGWAPSQEVNRTVFF